MPLGSEDVIVNDDGKAVRAILAERGLLRHFQIAVAMGHAKNMVIVDKLGNPGRQDMFCYFRGHEKPADNGFMLVSVALRPKDPPTAQRVFLEVIASLGPIDSMEAIYTSDQLINKGDQP